MRLPVYLSSHGSKERVLHLHGLEGQGDCECIHTHSSTRNVASLNIWLDREINSASNSNTLARDDIISYGELLERYGHHRKRIVSRPVA